MYSQTPLNPYPFGGLLGYWLEELRLKKRFFLGMGQEGFDCIQFGVNPADRGGPVVVEFCPLGWVA